MQPLVTMPAAVLRSVRYVLADIDDTLTNHGRLKAIAYDAMERLGRAGLTVVPITGRPAGWCDLIARQWPIAAVVGENGAFFYRYDDATRRMIRRYWKDERTRAADRSRLMALKDEILQAVPAASVAADQAFREADLAIDFAEDVGPLPEADIERIRAIFEASGATAKISSIHVNGWFGDYDKLSMTRILFAEVFAEDLDRIKAQVIFAGDSPNDQPMFGFFSHAVGVANIARFAKSLKTPPAYVTRAEGGDGFAELAEAILAARVGNNGESR